MEQEKIIVGLIHDSKTGLSITEIVKLTNQPRSTVRINLAHLEGANKIRYRKIGMAKVYISIQNISETQLQIINPHLVR
jgi:predicted transcriptional regulator